MDVTDGQKTSVVCHHFAAPWISPTKKDREDMQIISSQPFFHNGFLMARCRPIGHLERRNLPVWGKDPGSRDSEPRQLLPPCPLYHGA